MLKLVPFRRCRSKIDTLPKPQLKTLYPLGRGLGVAGGFGWLTCGSSSIREPRATHRRHPSPQQGEASRFRHASQEFPQ